MKRMLFVMFLAALLLFGCINLGGTPPPQENVTPPPPPPPAPKPAFSITEPVAGDVVLATDEFADINVVLSTSNFIVKPEGSAKKDGEGHFRVSLDEGSPVNFYTKTYTLNSVGIGSHTISVEIVNSDNTPYSPPIAKTVSFEVKKQEPQVYVPQNYTVTVGDNSYSPAEISVKVGDSVTWLNNGKQPQSATCFVDGKEKFDTDVIGPGKSATIAFNETLQCTYYSTMFMMMKGNITVESSG